MIPFRHYHLYTVLGSPSRTSMSESDRLALYFKQHRSLGSKDRQWISTQFFTILRYRRLLEVMVTDCGLHVTPETLVAALEQGWLEEADRYRDLPWPVRYSLSDDFAACLVRDYGLRQAEALGEVFLQEAPVFIRVNTAKISVEELQARLPYPCEGGQLPGSLRFAQRYPLQGTREFQQGLFEIQDESSQKIAMEIPITQGEEVLDFCAGAGGKSLVLAEKAHHVVLHDTRSHALQEARRRLLRAGYTNFSLFTHTLEQRFSTVVVDAPCSGSGVFRRCPEKKWKLSHALLHHYRTTQEMILKQASACVAPGGQLVYITCSILSDENEGHREYMHSLGWTPTYSERILPESGGGDGFFTMRFIRG